MDEIKQYIIVRKDLNMSEGKLSSQVGHACKLSYINIKDIKNGELNIKLTDVDIEWLSNDYKKITKYVKSEEKLLDLYNKANELGIRTSIVKDKGYTELEGENYTVITIGPDYDSKIQPLIKRLQNL